MSFSVLMIFFSLFPLGSGQCLAARAKARVKRVQNTTPILSDSERSSLRFRLENAWNEVDILVRNSGVDQKDVQKQERDLKSLSVYKKIPVASGANAQFTGVRNLIQDSLKKFGLTLKEAKSLGSSKPDRPIPDSLPPETQEFKLSEDQLAQKIRMDLVISGTKQQLQEWMNHWNSTHEPAADSGAAADDPVPYLEWDPNALTRLPEVLSDSKWKIHVQAYLFRDIRYPKLQPQDPLQLLPDWARQDPQTFKAQEPLLWSLVEKTQATIPKALPGYETKARFALNSARMTLFMSKVTHFD